jgi:DUF1680 family protein
VSIALNPATSTRFGVKVRLPNRDVSDLYTASPNADGVTSISVNGSVVTPPVENGYATIARTWKTGDTIDLTLPMKVQRIKGSDKIEATAGRIALRYGPLIYTVEKVDQDITQVLRSTSTLTPQWRADLLGGVMVLEGTWADGSTLTAIPCYARANREPSGPDRRRGSRGSPSAIVWLRDQ